jgi:hypothetical protein
MSHRAVLLAVIGLVAALVATLMFFGQSMTTSPPQPTRAIQARPTCDGLGLDELLFPREVVHPLNPTADDAARLGPLPYLAAMREPSLSCGAVQGDVFRLIQFERGGAPTIVRIARPADASVTAWVSQLEAPWWEGPGPLLVHETKALTPADWDRLQQAVAAARFWELPASEPGPLSGGSSWFLEGRRAWSYHVVLRTPSPGPFLDVAELMLSLARPPLPEPKAPR